jgi:hypothetical protein
MINPDTIPAAPSAASAFPVLIATALQAAPSLPLRRRVFLYRELAEIFGTAEEGQRFIWLANDLERNEESHAELALKLS